MAYQECRIDYSDFQARALKGNLEGVMFWFRLLDENECASITSGHVCKSAGASPGYNYSLIFPKNILLLQWKLSLTKWELIPLIQRLLNINRFMPYPSRSLHGNGSIYSTDMKSCLDNLIWLVKCMSSWYYHNICNAPVASKWKLDLLADLYASIVSSVLTGVGTFFISLGGAGNFFLHFLFQKGNGAHHLVWDFPEIENSM